MNRRGFLRALAAAPVAAAASPALASVAATGAPEVVMGASAGGFLVPPELVDAMNKLRGMYGEFYTGPGAES